MAHQEVDALAIGPGAIQQALEGVAALMGHMGHPQAGHDLRPVVPIGRLAYGPALVADQPGAALGQPGLHQRADLRVDGDDPIFPGLRLGAAGHSSGLEVNVGGGQGQQFTDPPPAVNENQDGIHPRLRLVLPQLGDFLVAEPLPGSLRDGVRGQQFRIAAGDYVQLQGKAVQVSPEVFNGGLSAVTLPAAVNGILHMKRLDLLVGLLRQR